MNNNDERDYAEEEYNRQILATGDGEVDDTPEYHLQFCDRKANRNITGDFSAEHDATEVRLWVGTDGTLVCAVEKNARSGMWHVSGSDTHHWTPSQADKAHRTWKSAMCSLSPKIEDMIPGS